MRISGELPDKLVTILWEWGFSGSSNPISPRFVVSRPVFFTGTVVISLFRTKTMKQTMGSGVMGMGRGQITTQKDSHCSRQDSAVFLKCSLNCFKFLTNLQNSKKVDFDNFCQCSHLYNGGTAF